MYTRREKPGEYLQPSYFLLENVAMDAYSREIVSDNLGVEPIMINSNLFSAQSRERYYWTNISINALPELNPTTIRDILEEGDFLASKGSFTPLYSHQSRTGTKCVGALLTGKSTLRGYDGESPLRISNIRTNNRVYSIDSKHPTLISSNSGYILDGHPRKLTRVEMERLQTLPDGYTSLLSDAQARKAIGNGWTVEVIKHILKPLQNKSLEQLAEELHLYF